MSDKIRAAPAAAPNGSVCYAPLCDIGFGTGNAAVISQKGGYVVRFKLDRAKLVGRVLCVECESLMLVNGLHRARLPDGQVVWVRDVRDVLDSRGYSDDDTAA